VIFGNICHALFLLVWLFWVYFSLSLVRSGAAII